MCLITNNIFCVGGEKLCGFYLFDVSKFQYIKNIPGWNVYSINKCFNNLILCSITDKNGKISIIKYKYDEKNISLEKIDEKEYAHKDSILSCIELAGGIIASSGKDCLIKLWKD